MIMKHRGEEIPEYMQAQYQSFLYPEKVKNSIQCGCYHCLAKFNIWDIKEWLQIHRDSNHEPIALCPYCRQDAIIGDAHGFAITDELLKDMHDYCYDPGE